MRKIIHERMGAAHRSPQIGNKIQSVASMLRFTLPYASQRQRSLLIPHSADIKLLIPLRDTCVVGNTLPTESFLQTPPFSAALRLGDTYELIDRCELLQAASECDCVPFLRHWAHGAPCRGACLGRISGHCPSSTHVMMLAATLNCRACPQTSFAVVSCPPSEIQYLPLSALQNTAEPQS